VTQCETSMVFPDKIAFDGLLSQCTLLSQLHQGFV
jgi:hypothetical protein